MEIQDAIVQQVVKAAAKKIDIDALAERLAPQMADEIVRCAVQSVEESEMLYDVLREAMQMPAVKKALTARLAAAFAP